MIIEAAIIVHHIRRDRPVRACLAQAGNLEPHEISRPVRHKTLPVKRQPMYRHLPADGRRLDLIKALVLVAPECSIPAAVHLVNRPVTFLQPGAEFLLAQRAIAGSPILVGDVPHPHARMLPETACQLLVDDLHLPAVNRRRITMVMPSPEKRPVPRLVDAQHLRIFVRKPFRPCAGRRRENHGHPVLIQLIYNIFHPFKPEDSFLRLERSPRKDPHRYRIDMRCTHQLDILLQNLRMLQPLVRIVIAAIEQTVKLYHNLPPRQIPRKQNVNSILPSAFSRYSSCVLAPQELSPPTPICPSEARITV